MGNPVFIRFHPGKMQSSGFEKTDFMEGHLGHCTPFFFRGRTEKNWARSSRCQAMAHLLRPCSIEAGAPQLYKLVFKTLYNYPYIHNKSYS